MADLYREDLRRGPADEGAGPAGPRPLVRARAARDRYLRPADELRAAVAEGAQERLTGARGRLGAGSRRRGVDPGRAQPLGIRASGVQNVRKLEVLGAIARLHIEIRSLR